MAFSYATFEEVSARLVRARDWFRSIGLSTEGSRLAALEDVVGSLVQDLATQSPEQVLTRWGEKDSYWAVADARSFCEIAEQFASLPSHLLPRRKLATILTGPLDPTEENPADASVQARNFLAELELAADLSAKGIPPIGFDDLRVSFQGRDLWFESKRIHSHSQVPNHLAKATSQLTRSLPSPDSRGLIAIVLDRLTGVDRLILRATSDGHTLQAAAKVVEEFLKRHTALFRTKAEHRIIGLALVAHFLVYSPHRNIVGTSFNLAFVPWDIRESRDRDLLEDLVAHLVDNTPERELPPL
jgi:hypothetical protein